MSTTPSQLLQNCTSFNQKIVIPSSVTTITGNFLQNCASFNQEITIPANVTTIQSAFMQKCTSFTQTLTIPSTIISIGTLFMYNCDNFTSLVCNGGTALANSNQTLATQTNTAPMYVTGVTLTGTYATNWKNKYADRTSTPYRKLILGS